MALGGQEIIIRYCYIILCKIIQNVLEVVGCGGESVYGGSGDCDGGGEGWMNRSLIY